MLKFIVIAVLASLVGCGAGNNTEPQVPATAVGSPVVKMPPPVLVAHGGGI